MESLRRFPCVLQRSQAVVLGVCLAFALSLNAGIGCAQQANHPDRVEGVVESVQAPDTVRVQTATCSTRLSSSRLPRAEPTPAGPTRPSLLRHRPSALFNPRAQCFEDVVVEGNVVEGLPDDRFGDRARLPAITAEDNDTRIVVLHRQSPIVFGPSYFADILAALQLARGHTDRPRDTSFVKLLRVTRVDEHRRAV